MDGTDIGKMLNDVKKEVSGNGSNMFTSGNVGMAILAMAIITASKNIREGMNSLARGLSK